MVFSIFQTSRSISLAIIRLVLGVVFLAHGSQKVLGLFGGAGFRATMHTFEAGMHIPALFAFLAIAAEFLGGIGLILGLLARIGAIGIFCNMVVAIAKVHAKNGFFMNWSGRQAGEGFEYHLLVLAMCAAVMIAGAGSFSIDRAIAMRHAYRTR